MSASIHLIGVDKNLVSKNICNTNFLNTVVNEGIKTKILGKKVDVEILHYLFHNLPFVYSDENSLKKIGLDTLYSNVIKKHCSELNEMFVYFFMGFTWDNEISLEHKDSSFLLEKSTFLDLIDWYIALSISFSPQQIDFISYKNVRYSEEANNIKVNYSEDYEYFTFSLYEFMRLKEQTVESKYDHFFWTYSF